MNRNSRVRSSNLRLLLKIAAVVQFAGTTLVFLGAEAVLVGWLVDRYPRPFAWAGFVVLMFVDLPVFMVAWNAMARYLRRL